jgi:penicillin amidase
MRTIETSYGNAEVYYDEYGVPHIEVANEGALYYAVGYVQARDRLFQMDLGRRRMRGELSQAFGEQTLESDILFTKMDFVGAAEATWNLLEETELQPVFEAYTEGVNQYIENAESTPIEFQRLNCRPEPWTPLDSILLSKQIAWGLTGTFWDIERAAIATELGEDALSLYPEQYEHEYPIIPQGAEPPNRSDQRAGQQTPPEVSGSADSQEVVEWLQAVTGIQDDPIGSNNWIVSGEHTESGEPLLANDPHLSLSAPPVWYEMHVMTDEINLRGVAFPGQPIVSIGQNQHIAWGFTNVGADVIDFYQYEFGPDRERYRYEGEWQPVEGETETIDVRVGDEVETREVTVRKTVHGPLLERQGRDRELAGLASRRRRRHSHCTSTIMPRPSSSSTTDSAISVFPAERRLH